MDSRTNVTTPISALGGDAEFEVWQDGMPVAVACGPEADALQEALHYYAQYSQDGPVELFKVVRVKVVFGRAPATQEGNEG